MSIWLVWSGWMGNGAEAVFVEAPTKGTAIAKALEIFKTKLVGELNAKSPPAFASEPFGTW